MQGTANDIGQMRAINNVTAEVLMEDDDIVERWG